MAALIRAHDWSRTPLGPPETWRAPLKAMVRMALTTRHPIFTNAAKYTDPGGHLRLDVRAVADRVLCDVSDDGIGLAPDMRVAVFEMFHQVKDARDRTQGGLGIGLSLSQGLAALHGGRVEAFSDGIGRGSTFRLTLPVDADAGVGVGVGVDAGANGGSVGA